MTPPPPQFLLITILIISSILASSHIIPHIQAAGICEKQHDAIIDAIFKTPYEDDVSKFTLLDRLSDKVLLKNSPAIGATGNYKIFAIESFEGKDAVMEFWRAFLKYTTITTYRKIIQYIPEGTGGARRMELSRLGMSVNSYHWNHDFFCDITFETDGSCTVKEWSLTYDPSFLLIASKSNANVAMPQSASVEPSFISSAEGGITDKATKDLATNFAQLLLNDTTVSEHTIDSLFGTDNKAIVTFPGDQRSSTTKDLTGAFRGRKQLKAFFDQYFNLLETTKTPEWKIAVNRNNALLFAEEGGRFNGRRFSNLRHYILLQTDEQKNADGTLVPRIHSASHIFNPVVLSGDIRFQSATKGVSLIMQIVLACLVVILSVLVGLLTLYIVMKNAEQRLLMQRRRGKRAMKSGPVPEEMQPLRLHESEEDEGEYTSASRVAFDLNKNQWIEPNEAGDEGESSDQV